MAAHQGHAVIVSQLCRVARVEVDALDNAGCTPLHHATALGHDGVVMELWSKSANVDLADANGWTGMWLHCSQSRAHCLLPFSTWFVDSHDAYGTPTRGIGQKRLEVQSDFSPCNVIKPFDTCSSFRLCARSHS